MWRTLRARLLARAGDPAAALAYAAAAVDWPNVTADAVMVLAIATAATGRRTKSAHALRRAEDRYRLKGNLIGERRTRAAVVASPV